jgi:hypothetical protein
LAKDSRSHPSPLATSQDEAPKVVQLRTAPQPNAPTSILLPTVSPITQAVQLAKASGAQDAAAFSSANNTEKDSVQITIGRVEVRAVTGDARPVSRTSKPATPRLTLDDYLRERSGGRR